MSFATHMALHMGMVAVVAPVLAFALAGSRWDPVVRWPKLFPPVPVSLLELAAVWVWHLPLLHHAARHTWTGLLLEQATFLLAGLALWLSCFGGTPERRAARAGAGVAAMLLTSMHMTLLGALLALTPRVLYSHGGHESLADQHLGGVIMLAIGGVAYLAAGLWLTASLLARKTVREAA